MRFALAILFTLAIWTVALAADRPVYRPGEIDKFGTYSLRYYEKRWRAMCKGPARYDAMREASAMGRPQPCK